MTNPQDLTGCGVVITGGLGDIGSAICRAVAERGATVHILDSKERGEADSQLRDLTARSGAQALYSQIDVRDFDAVSSAINSTPSLYGVVANAGIGMMTPFLEMNPREWDAQIGINLTGAFNTGLAGAKGLAERGGGYVVLISSWIGSVPWPGMAAYCASKGGINMLAKAMARDLAQHQIRVNVVAPGIVDAGPSKRIMAENAAYKKATETVIPFGRLQRTDEVAWAVSTLIGDQARYTTGAVFTTDGGCSLFQFEGS